MRNGLITAVSKNGRVNAVWKLGGIQESNESGTKTTIADKIETQNKEGLNLSEVKQGKAGSKQAEKTKSRTTGTSVILAIAGLYLLLMKVA